MDFPPRYPTDGTDLPEDTTHRGGNYEGGPGGREYCRLMDEQARQWCSRLAECYARASRTQRLKHYPLFKYAMDCYYWPGDNGECELRKELEP